ncbi:AbgT family transporter [Pseudactinotalea terrae]|uniref:AbgT family transporter n=1 Tax=Pseudactinotalea terrae TaxID=1743262 RepID=UPI0012E1AFA3|nr:AbgT family transporter [Pseudactinotalea terrae]
MSSAADTTSPGAMARLLDGIERLGNKVPNPTLLFVYLIGFIAVLSMLLAWAGVSVTDDVVVPVPTDDFLAINEHLGGTYSLYDSTTGLPATLPEFVVVEEEFPIRSLISIEGARFFFSSFVDNFAGFGVVAVVIVSMAGVGAAEAAGLMAALIRRVVKVAPPKLLPFILIFVGVLSSVATDAGYLILIPLAAAAYASVGRHPLAGMAGVFAAVGAVFGVNLLITPSDSMITEITNDVLGTLGMESINVTQNFYFSIVSSLVLAVVVTFLTTKFVEPRLGKYDPAEAGNALVPAEEVDAAAEARGLRFAGFAALGVVAVMLALSLPPGAPLRDPATGDLIGTTPFMASLIFAISLAFLICGIAYGRGANTLKTGDEIVAAISKTIGSLGGLLVMFLMIAQFIALFNWTNLPTVAAVEAAQLLEQAEVPALVLLIAFILVIVVLDIILPGLIPKWAIFAPVFIPIFATLGVAPQTLLAAYRVGDSPINVVTPLMVYLPFIVTIAQRYVKKSGLGTVISLMLPYTVVVLVTWIVLYVAWFLLGIPWGPDAPVQLT